MVLTAFLRTRITVPDIYLFSEGDSPNCFITRTKKPTSVSAEHLIKYAP